VKLTQDWHIHTFRSGCGKEENTVQAIVETAEKGGLRLVGLSDHINLPEETDFFLDVVKKNREDLSSLNTQCTVLVGTEATMLSPTECCVSKQVEEAVDYVMVSCNHYHLMAVEKPLSQTSGAFARHHLDMIRGAIELGYTHTIAHPFYCSKCGAMAPAILHSIELSTVQELLREAAQAGVAFEIKPVQAGLAIPWFKDLVAEGRRQGVRFTLGSDAHALRPIGYPEEPPKMSAAQVCAAIGLKDEDLCWG